MSRRDKNRQPTRSIMKDIELHLINKTYEKGKVQAVQDISLSIEKGELFGLIGPDGAGKTTLFRILTTLLLADSGTATVNGLDVVKDYKKIRKRVGYMPGRFSLYQDLSVAENLNFFATVFGTTVAENYELIKDIYVQLEPFKDRKAGALSGGMKQKLALCCALIHKPKVLFLDEPTTGVDVVSRREFWEMLRNLKEHGITILVSTPYMDEAKLCDRIALIQNGKIMSIDTPKEIIKSYPQPLYAAQSGNMSQLLNDLRQLPQVQSCYSFGEYHHFTVMKDIEHVDKTIREALTHKNHVQIELKRITPTIEDCFIDLMEKETVNRP